MRSNKLLSFLSRFLLTPSDTFSTQTLGRFWNPVTSPRTAPATAPVTVARPPLMMVDVRASLNPALSSSR